MHTCPRTFLAVILMCLPCFADATKNPWVWPQSITVSFKHGDRVVFTISEDKIAGITIYVDGNALAVPKNVCAKLQYVQFDSVHIVYPVGAVTLKAPDWFQVQFRIGPESRRSGGELPEVQLNFRDAKFEHAAVTVRRADGWFTADL
jgi:hypothetical protein